jgi:tight adherence protein B
MDGVLLPLLVAATVVTLSLGVWQLATALMDKEKKKLTERLSADNSRFDPAAASARAIKIQVENDNVPSLLSRSRFFKELNRQLAQTLPGMSLVKFLVISCALAALGGLVLLLLSGSLIPAAVASAGAGYLPFCLLSSKRSRRAKALNDQLPEALDFLSRALKAGHSLSTGLQMMADELPNPLAAEFRQCYDQHSLGQSLDDALKDTAGRIESTDFAFFVTAVLIQRQTGGDLSEVLRNISGMIRQRVRLHQQVRAKTAEGRFTGYIMVAFPVVMFFIASTLNPEYSQILLHTPTGLRMVAVAFGLQMAGLLAIRKITTVKV